MRGLAPGESIGIGTTSKYLVWVIPKLLKSDGTQEPRKARKLIRNGVGNWMHGNQSSALSKVHFSLLSMCRIWLVNVRKLTGIQMVY